MKYIIKNIVEAKHIANEILSRTNACCGIKRPYKRPIFGSNDINFGLATGVYKIFNIESENDVRCGRVDEDGVKYILWRTFSLKSNRAIFVREDFYENRRLLERIAWISAGVNNAVDIPRITAPYFPKQIRGFGIKGLSAPLNIHRFH